MTVLGLELNDGSGDIVMARADAATGRLLVSSSGAGSGTVTSVSVVSANGFAGTVATATTTPAITLTTTVTGILSGNGTAISAASTTGSGAVVLANTPTLITPVLGVATGTSLSLSAATTLSLGTASTNTGAIVFKNSTNANTLTIQSGVTTGATVLTLPVDDGTPSQVLQTDGSGVLSWVTPAAGMAIGGTVTSGTAGSVLFVDTGPVLAQDNTNFFWDTTNKTLAIGGTDVMTVNGATVTSRFVGHASDTATGSVSEMHQHSNTAGRGAVAYFARSRGSAGAPTVVSSGDSVGQLDAVAYDGTDYATMASIEFEVDGTPGSNDMPGRILFKTSPDGTQTLTTALTLKNDQSATFAGTVTMPTPFTLGATSVTTTGVQLNYLNAATGTTGTTSTNVVFSTSPTLVTPVLGVATATSINKVAITAPATSATLTIADGKTLTSSNTLTLAGTDGNGINVGAATIGKILIGDGTNMVLSANTFPNASATSGKVIKSDGTNWVASTETYAAPGTSGNVLTSDGTNWTSAAPSAGTTIHSLISCDFSATGRITTSLAGGGTVTFGADGMTVNSSATGSSTALARFSFTSGSGYGGDANPTFTWRLRFSGVGTADNDEAFVGIGEPGGGSGAALTYTSNHIGFKFIRAASSTDMFATVGDGVTESVSSAMLTGLTSSDLIELTAVVTTGTAVSFYVRKNGGALSSATVLNTHCPAAGANLQNGVAVASNKNNANQIVFIASGFSLWN